MNTTAASRAVLSGRTKSMPRLLLPAVAMAMVLTSLACRAQQASPGKLAITVGDKVFSAAVADSTTARDFVSLLPLTLTMKDLFKREKWADLPRPLAEGGDRVRTYQVGDIIYWSPSDHVAIYYRNDGQSIPSPGIIVLARIEAGAGALDVPGDVKVTIEAVK